MKKAITKKSLAKTTKVKWDSADDAPILTKALLKKAVAMPPITDSSWAQKMDELTKKSKKTSEAPKISLSSEVFGWFKAHSKNYEASIDHVLRHYILSHDLPR